MAAGAPSAGALVNRATSDLLIGPDWAMNLEICDILNRDPGQGRNVARGLKKRLGSRNPKVQLLALTLLETVVKNCSDIVHMHIADKGIPQKMVKIAKKKQPDVHVKEKILVLIYTWQEGFGGPQARHPQYFTAYQELLQAGAVFPKRLASSAPVFTPAQTVPSPSHLPTLQNSELQEQAAESSDGSGLPPLSLSDIESAHGIVEVLEEMLSALDPLNKEGSKQDVIIDLIEQCHSYKKRVLDLVNNTFMNEELLSKGLALNDDLERVLAKHELIAAGSAAKPKSLKALVDIDDCTVTDQGSSTDQDGKSTQNTSSQSPLDQLLLTAPPLSDNAITTSTPIDTSIDLLSGEGFTTPEKESSLALVPVSQPVSSSETEQNALVLSDLYLQNNVNGDPAILFGPNSANTAPQTSPLTELQVPPQSAFYSNGGVPQSDTTENEQGQGSYSQDVQFNQAGTPWTGHVIQQQNLHTYGSSDDNGALPPPPWEAKQAQSNQQIGNVDSTLIPQIQSNQIGSYPLLPSNQLVVLQSQPVQFQPIGNAQQPIQGGYPHIIQGTQMGNMNQPAQLMVYAYGQQPTMQFYDQRAAYSYGNQHEIAQRMYGFSMQDNSAYMTINSSNHMASSSPYLPPSGKPSKPEDKLFGDLVTIAKSKTK